MNTLFDGFSKKLKPEGIKWKQGVVMQNRSMSESVYKSLEIEYIYVHNISTNAASLCFGCV